MTVGYLTQDEIANSTAMLARVAQAAAGEGFSDPERWSFDHRRFWASAPGWDDAWESWKVSHPDDGDPTTLPLDPGRDEGVITDGQILSQVQAMGENFQS